MATPIHVGTYQHFKMAVQLVILAHLVIFTAAGMTLLMGVPWIVSAIIAAMEGYFGLRLIVLHHGEPRDDLTK